MFHKLALIFWNNLIAIISWRKPRVNHFLLYFVQILISRYHHSWLPHWINTLLLFIFFRMLSRRLEPNIIISSVYAWQNHTISLTLYFIWRHNNRLLLPFLIYLYPLQFLPKDIFISFWLRFINLYHSKVLCVVFHLQCTLHLWSLLGQGVKLLIKVFYFLVLFHLVKCGLVSFWTVENAVVFDETREGF